MTLMSTLLVSVLEKCSGLSMMETEKWFVVAGVFDGGDDVFDVILEV